MKKLTSNEILKLKNKKVGRIVLRMDNHLLIDEPLCLTDSQIEDLKCFLNHFIYHNHDDETYLSWYRAEANIYEDD